MSDTENVKNTPPKKKILATNLIDKATALIKLIANLNIGNTDKNELFSAISQSNDPEVTIRDAISLLQHEEQQNVAQTVTPEQPTQNEYFIKNDLYAFVALQEAKNILQFEQSVSLLDTWINEEFEEEINEGLIDYGKKLVDYGKETVNKFMNGTSATRFENQIKAFNKRISGLVSNMNYDLQKLGYNPYSTSAGKQIQDAINYLTNNANSYNIKSNVRQSPSIGNTNTTRIPVKPKPTKQISKRNLSDEDLSKIQSKYKINTNNFSKILYMLPNFKNEKFSNYVVEMSKKISELTHGFQQDTAIDWENIINTAKTTLINTVKTTLKTPAEPKPVESTITSPTNIPAT